MTYEKAKQKALEQLWKIGTCSQGESCWCRTIELETPIPYTYISPNHTEVEEELKYIIGQGEVDKSFVEHIVLQHNQYLEFLNDDRI